MFYRVKSNKIDDIIKNETQQHDIHGTKVQNQMDI